MKKSEDEYVIGANEIVTVTQMNNIIEIQHMEKMNTQANIKKLNKHEYVDLKTGEIKEFNHFENRKDSYNSLRQTFKKLRFLINNNFSGKKNELWVTLTYRGADQTNNIKQVSKDYDNFRGRFDTRFKKKSTIDMLKILEPHASGNWHLHVLIRFNDVKSIYIHSSEMAELWGRGFATVKSLKDIDNIGAYVSAYLTDLEFNDKTAGIALTEDREIEVKKVDGEDKKFIKGGRLHMYPPGANIFSKSKGIIYPERKKTTYKKAKKIVGSAKPHFKTTKYIEKEDFENAITYEQYNLKRT